LLLHRRFASSLQAYEELLEEAGGEAAAVQRLLLDSDLRKLAPPAGKPTSVGLPEDINRAASSSVKGPLVLQVAQC
jgi:hypothetical protein